MGVRPAIRGEFRGIVHSAGGQAAGLTPQGAPGAVSHGSEGVVAPLVARRGSCNDADVRRSGATTNSIADCPAVVTIRRPVTIPTCPICATRIMRAGVVNHAPPDDLPGWSVVCQVGAWLHLAADSDNLLLFVVDRSTKVQRPTQGRLF